MNRNYQALDESLELLAPYAPEYRGGLANHAPMACEALCAMGRHDSAVAWVADYRRRLLPALSPRARISRDAWAHELANYDRVADWVAFFDNELAEAPWPVVLDRWVARLAHGFSAAAMHGVIRAGHAARALIIGENAARRHELAQGLGYWAARFETLPEIGNAAGSALPSRAIADVVLLPNERRRVGLLAEGLAQLETFEPFAHAAALVDTAGDPSRFISDLTATFARVYLTNAIDRLTAIAFIHCVTGPSALRPLLPHLSADTTRRALRYAWQSTAAMYAAFATNGIWNSPLEPAAIAADDLIDRAVANGDEHAIKLTEACLREHALSADPAYLAAADNALRAL